MRSKQHYSRFLKLIMAGVIIVAALSGGCGIDDPYTAGYGGSVVISPTDITYSLATYPPCAGTCGSFTCSEYASFKITVLDANDLPVNNAAITIQVPFSFGSGGGASPTLMYVFDSDKSAPVYEYPYNTMTGDNGTKDITLWLDTSCAWGPVSVSVWSGSAFGSLEVTVN